MSDSNVTKGVRFQVTGALGYFYLTSYKLGPVHTYPIRLYPQTFRCSYAYRPHVSSENDNRNRKLLKTLSRVESFENATNPDTCGGTETATI